MEWWIWCIIGMSLLCAEVFLPLDFFLFFIGLSFICSGALSYFSIIEDSTKLFIITGVISFISLFTLRPFIRNFFKRETSEVGTLLGQMITVTENISPGEKGSGTLNGSTWQVHNRTDETLTEGKSYQVSSRESITLIIE
jgi:membrane protein implicated in regulation of membrane protease activity